MRKTFAILLIVAGLALPIRPILDYQWAGHVGLAIFGSALLIAAGLTVLEKRERPVATPTRTLRINFRTLLWPAYHALIVAMIGIAFWLHFTRPVEAVAQANPQKYRFRTQKITGADASAFSKTIATIDSRIELRPDALDWRDQLPR